MRRSVVALIIIVLGGVLAYLYVFHKPHRDILAEEASHLITADALIEMYENSMDSANAMYLDHVVELEGEVSDVDSASITLMPGVYCHFHGEPGLEKVNKGDIIKVKGRVVGYDDLFGEVKMDYCTL